MELTAFTTRPEIKGTFGVVTSTHWIASAVGMSILERGGNAFDTAVATGFVLQIVEPHLNGPGGDVPILFQLAGADRPQILCGQGVAPEKATIDYYRSEGHHLVPGTGFLAAVVPGSFAAWLSLLRDHGTMNLADVLAPTIFYAREGFPLVPRIVDAIADVSAIFLDDWPTSAAIYLPGGKPPPVDQPFRNPKIAETWERILSGCKGAGSREREIDIAIEQIYRGFVAETIVGFIQNPLRDSSGRHSSGILSRDDFANWSPTYEAPLSYGFGDYEVFKGGAWTQGPAFLQQLALLKSLDLDKLDPTGTDFVHLVTEASKLAFADREAFYGDPDFVDVPIETLLSDAYNDERRALISPNASFDLCPGTIAGFSNRLADPKTMLAASGVEIADGAGEPTMARYDDKVQKATSGDTCHLDIIDRWGNMVAATPSGGWLQSSPTIPDLGFSLTTRAQMFWLEEGLPASLAPFKRPRATLSPSLAHRDGKPYLVWGTPGGDQQDQWTLVQFLRHVLHGQNLQEICDSPMFHSAHFPSSFYPRQAQPGRLVVEDRFSGTVIQELRSRGHDVAVDGPWTVGRMTAASRDGAFLKAGASPRGLQGYAIGR
ncbi:MAG: gamma-glutamyltransferase family protein [Pseudomonadota bacterium]